MNRATAALLLAALAAACNGDRPDAGPPPSAEVPVSTHGPRFQDVTAASGVRFVHFNDATSRRYLPETMGAGVAVFDYDGDGDSDLYLVNGAPLRGNRDAGPSPALFRNAGDGRFTEVAAPAGLAEPIFGMGAAVGDVDHDGAPDLLVTAVGGDRLYLNRGDGTFEDATATAGLGPPGFSSSAAFLDFDRDGFLDLFVGRYVRWSVEDDVRCSADGENPVYCTPEVYEGATNRLYRNLGGAVFADVTRAAGVERPEGKTLGVVSFDHDGDGWPDLAVANDTVRNFLFRNEADGTFREIGLTSGMALSESGAPRGGMGIDTGDLDGDERDEIVIGNFSQEMAALFRPNPAGLYVDDAAPRGLGLPTLMSLTFGTLVLDVDGDGWLDVILANGHIEPEIRRTQQLQAYAQPMQLFLGGGAGSLEELKGGAGSPLAAPRVGRGLAAGDLDRDGDADLVLTQNGGHAVVLRNDSPARAWIRLDLRDRLGSGTVYGAQVTLHAAGRVLHRTLRSGRSYLSASEPAVTIGLGSARRVDRLEIRWPSGTIQILAGLPAGRAYRVTEPGGP